MVIKTIWFKPFGWICIPVHLLAIAFMIPVCMIVILNGHSVTDDLYEIFVYSTCTAFWWKWIAEKTSHKQ